MPNDDDLRITRIMFMDELIKYMNIKDVGNERSHRRFAQNADKLFYSCSEKEWEVFCEMMAALYMESIGATGYTFDVPVKKG